MCAHGTVSLQIRGVTGVYTPVLGCLWSLVEMLVQSVVLGWKGLHVHVPTRRCPLGSALEPGTHPRHGLLSHRVRHVCLVLFCVKVAQSAELPPKASQEESDTPPGNGGGRRARLPAGVACGTVSSVRGR